MKFIDIENWKRREHFDFFKQLDYPHFNICCNLDITEFKKYISDNKLPFFISALYAASKAANEIPEFRLRIREDKVIEHEKINPSFTLITEEEVFSFCKTKFMEKFVDFRQNTQKDIEMAKGNVNMKDEPGQDNLLFITSIPWISFTSIAHPIQMKAVDSIPRISWGKFFEENDKIKLPLSVQVHHALVDGIHVGQYINRLQNILDKPDEYFL